MKCTAFARLIFTKDIEPDFPSLADEKSKPRQGMNIKGDILKF